MGEEMFMIYRIGKCELVPRIHMYVVKAYKKMHVGLTFQSLEF